MQLGVFFTKIPHGKVGQWMKRVWAKRQRDRGFFTSVFLKLVLFVNYNWYIIIFIALRRYVSRGGGGAFTRRLWVENKKRKLLIAVPIILHNNAPSRKVVDPYVKVYTVEELFWKTPISSSRYEIWGCEFRKRKEETWNPFSHQCSTWKNNWSSVSLERGRLL